MSYWSSDLCSSDLDAIWNGLALSGDKPIERLRPAIERVSRDIDAQFVHLLASPNDPRRRLYEAMRHAAIGGGKRLRPLLVQATCELFHIDPAAALRVGVAIECIHVYSLVHDDLPCMSSEEHTSELQSLMRISSA